MAVVPEYLRICRHLLAGDDDVWVGRMTVIARVPPQKVNSEPGFAAGAV